MNIYYKNCEVIARHEFDETRDYLNKRYNYTHAKEEICGYCLSEVATGEDGKCDECREVCKELELMGNFERRL